MASLTYDDIFSTFFLQAEAYDVLVMDDMTTDKVQCGWLHLSVNSYVRRLFTEFTMDDDERTITYTLSYPLTEEEDTEFVMNIQGKGMLIQWLTPKVNSFNLTSQVYGSKEEKYYSQAAHLEQLREQLKRLQYEQRAEIRDRGYANNAYLDGTVALRT